MADEPTQDTNDSDPSQYRADRWRADPKALREAVRNSREAYQRSPKAAPRLTDAGCLIGESKGGTVLYGVVVADAVRAGEVYTELQEIADTLKEVFRGRKARIQVFIPPDWSSAGPTSVAGVRVDWFRWVPLSEHEVRVEKLAARSVAASLGTDDGVIARLLGQLKWLTELAKSAPDEKPPIGWAFRTYNAAVQLQFHIVFPLEGQTVTRSDSSSKLESAIATFVEIGAKVTKPLRTAKGLAAASDTTIRKGDRNALVKAVEKVLKQARRAEVVQDVTAARQQEFEHAPDVSKLLRSLTEHGWGSTASAQAAEAALEGEPELAELCRAVAGVVATRSPTLTGRVRPAAQAAAQEMATGFLGVAVENLPQRHKVVSKAARVLCTAMTACDTRATNTQQQPKTT